MIRLLGALLAGAVAFSPSLVLGEDSDSKPVSKMERDEAKEAREAAKAKWDKMTHEEQATARKAARNKKLSDATALDIVATENMQLYDQRTPLMGDFPSPNDPMRRNTQQEKGK